MGGVSLVSSDVVYDRLVIIGGGNDGRRWVVGRVIDVGKESTELIGRAHTGDDDVRTTQSVGELGAKVGGVDDQHVRVRQKVERRSGRRESDRFVFDESKMSLRC
jgi:hypothetical protein